MRVVILTIALGLLVVPTVITQSSLNIDKQMSYNTVAEPYRERGEVHIDPEGNIWSRASVEGTGVQFQNSPFDYGGPEWGRVFCPKNRLLLHRCGRQPHHRVLGIQYSRECELGG